MSAPKNIAKIHPHNDGSFQFLKPVTKILSLVSNQTETSIQDTKIYCRTIRRFIPWYRTSKGGGAITLGSRRWKSITFTENFFSVDSSKYGDKTYGNNIMAWLQLSAHEVGHIKQSNVYGSLILYVLVFLFQYLRYGHDKAPLEIEADKGYQTLLSWSQFLSKYSIGNFEELLESDKSDSEKIKILESWWAQFQKYNTNPDCL